VATESDRLVGCPVDEMSLWDRIQAGHEFPLEVMLCLTERCPLECGHCYIPPDPSADELAFVEIEQLLDELKELGTIKLILTGGEPALRPDLAKILKAATTRRFATALKTSCFPLADKDVDGLWEAGLTELNASLYHNRPDDHDRFVGRAGAWNKVVQTLDRFAGLGGVSRVSIVAMEWNASAIPELIDLCETRGWPYAVDPRVIHREDGADGPLALRVDEDALQQVLADMRLEAAPIPPREASSPVCLAGRNSAYVTPCGEVWPCPNLPLSFGNLRQATFAEIWRGSAERARILGIRWSDSEACSDCEAMGFCERCPGEAFLEHGDPTQPSAVDCLLARARAKHSHRG
jgi:radical SAM protein with 4Fe4S-binding SPASM domain